MIDVDVERAKLITKALFKGHVDKGGNDYFEHHLKVVAGLVEEWGYGKDYIITGYLHDMLEDIKIIKYEYLKTSFGIVIADAVRVLTKTENIDYDVYLEEIKKNPIARIVKLADMTNNSDLSRIPKPVDADFKRVEKYKKGIEFLNAN